MLDDGPIFIFVSPCVDGCKLAYLDLRECIHFTIEDISNYLFQNQNNLKMLKLDDEYSNVKYLINNSKFKCFN